MLLVMLKCASSTFVTLAHPGLMLGSAMVEGVTMRAWPRDLDSLDRLERGGLFERRRTTMDDCEGEGALTYDAIACLGGKNSRLNKSMPKALKCASNIPRALLGAQASRQSSSLIAC